MKNVSELEAKNKKLSEEEAKDVNGGLDLSGDPTKLTNTKPKPIGVAW